jgi:hypothetical protein
MAIGRIFEFKNFVQNFDSLPSNGGEPPNPMFMPAGMNIGKSAYCRISRNCFTHRSVRILIRSDAPAI